MIPPKTTIAKHATINAARTAVVFQSAKKKESTSIRPTAGPSFSISSSIIKPFLKCLNHLFKLVVLKIKDVRSSCVYNIYEQLRKTQVRLGQPQCSQALNDWVNAFWVSQFESRFSFSSSSSTAFSHAV